MFLRNLNNWNVQKSQNFVKIFFVWCGRKEAKQPRGEREAELEIILFPPQKCICKHGECNSKVQSNTEIWVIFIAIVMISWKNYEIFHQIYCRITFLRFFYNLGFSFTSSAIMWVTALKVSGQYFLNNRTLFISEILVLMGLIRFQSRN